MENTKPNQSGPTIVADRSGDVKRKFPENQPNCAHFPAKNAEICPESGTTQAMSAHPMYDRIFSGLGPGGKKISGRSDRPFCPYTRCEGAAPPTETRWFNGQICLNTRKIVLHSGKIRCIMSMLDPSKYNAAYAKLNTFNFANLPVNNCAAGQNTKRGGIL